MSRQDRITYLGEFWASFILGYLGLGLVENWVVHGDIGNMFCFGLAFGAIIALVIIVFGPISGAHFNPSATLALAAVGAFPKRKVIPYLIMQFLGWGAGAAALYLTWAPAITDFEAAQGIVRESVGAATGGIFYCGYTYLSSAIIMEFVATAMLIMFMLSFLDENNGFKPSMPIFGITIGILIWVIVTYSGHTSATGLNPARDFAPRLVAYLFGWKGAFTGHWWIYLVVPPLGGIFGAFAYTKFLGKWVAELLPASEAESVQ